MSIETSALQRLSHALGAGRDDFVLLLRLESLLPERLRHRLSDRLPALIYGLRRAMSGAVVVVTDDDPARVDGLFSPVRVPVLSVGAGRWRAHPERPGPGDVITDEARTHWTRLFDRPPFAGRSLLMVGAPPWPLPASAGGVVVVGSGEEDPVAGAAELIGALAGALVQRLNG